MTARKSRLFLAYFFLLLLAVLTGIPAAVLIGALISAAISVGTTLLTSLLAPKPPGVERNKQEIKISTSSYGNPIVRGYGKFACGGSVIYRGEIVDTVTTQRGSGKRRTPDVSTHSYSVSFGVLVCDARGGNVLGISRIWADDKLLYEGATDGNEVLLGEPGGSRTAAGARRFNIKLGGESQLPNTWYEADLGIGRVSAHRGVVTCWWDDFGLDEWFNRIPNLIFEVVKSDGQVNTIITRECAMVGLASGDLEIPTLTQSVAGLILAQVQPPRQTIEVLSQAFQFNLVEVDGKLKGVTLPQQSSAVIAFGQMGAVQGGPEENQEAQAHVTAGIEQPFEVPRLVTVSYFEADRNYEQGTQQFGRQIYPSSATLSINWPLVMSPTEANRRARILAVTAWTERFPFKFTLPPKFIRYHPGDVLTITAINGRQFDVRITEMAFAPTEVIEVTAVRQVADAYTQTGKAGTSLATSTVTTPQPPRDSELWLSNVPAIVDLHNNVAGIYGAISPASFTLGEWRGAVLYRNYAGTDETNPNYFGLATFPLAATMGKALTTLPSATGLDVTNTLRVKLQYGTLETITQTVFDTSSDVNLAVVNKEIIQFRDASLVAGTTDTYDLSRLRRGLRGTAPFVGDHSGNDRFVLYNDAVQRIPLNLSDKGKTFNYKPVTSGQEVDDVNPVPFVFENLL